MSAVDDPRIRIVRGHGIDPAALLARLDEPIEISLPTEEMPLRTQLLAITLTEILARVFPCIRATGDLAQAAAAGLPPGPPSLGERLERARQRGHRPLLAPPTSSALVTVCVGHGGVGDLYVDGAGWQSYVGRIPSRLNAADDTLPVGPLCAAARAAAHVFRRVLGDLLPETPGPAASCYWSALDYAASSEPLARPETVTATSVRAILAGLGSVGGAAVYLLRHMADLSGQLYLVDPQLLEQRNYVRALLADFDSAAAQLRKTDVAKTALDHHGALKASAHFESFAEYVAARSPEAALPLVACSVDTIPDRRSIQDAMPLEIINAACSTSNVVVSGHRTGEGPCPYCIYIEQVLDKDNILVRLIERRTGLTAKEVNAALARGALLPQNVLARIARYNDLPADAFDAYLDRPLIELYRAELVYGESPVADGSAAVAAPFITALAGFLLAAEVLKASTPALQPFRLGPQGELRALGGTRPTKYEEAVFSSPHDALLMSLPRWETPACLCRSERRLELMRARYGLTPS